MNYSRRAPPPPDAAAAVAPEAVIIATPASFLAVTDHEPFSAPPLAEEREPARSPGAPTLDELARRAEDAGAFNEAVELIAAVSKLAGPEDIPALRSRLETLAIAALDARKPKAAGAAMRQVRRLAGDEAGLEVMVLLVRSPAMQPASWRPLLHRWVHPLTAADEQEARAAWRSSGPAGLKAWLRSVGDLPKGATL